MYIYIEPTSSPYIHQINPRCVLCQISFLHICTCASDSVSLVAVSHPVRISWSGEQRMVRIVDRRRRIESSA